MQKCETSMTWDLGGQAVSRIEEEAKRGKGRRSSPGE